MSTTFGRFSIVLVLLITLPEILFAFDGGDGSEADPFQISTPEHLISIGSNPDLLDKHYIMVADVNMVGYEFDRAVIAPDMKNLNYLEFNGTAFTGVFDGDKYVISNLKVETRGNDFIGLFGQLREGGEVKNLGIENAEIKGKYIVGSLAGENMGGALINCYTTGSTSGDSYIGGLCGRSYKGTISNAYSTGMVKGNNIIGGLCGWKYAGTTTYCYATGAVTGNDYHVGGLCGYNDAGTINNCYATGAVKGHRAFGGLCGKNKRGTITNCHATGAVAGTSYHVGGLCGHNDAGTINNCYATGAVTGDNYLGSLCGYNNDGAITNCYAIGTVAGKNGLGGLCGWNDGGIIINCFWDIETSGLSTSAGGSGLTTVQMQTMSTFVDAGWDFIDETENGTSEIWQMPEGGGYPVLSSMSGYIPIALSGDGSEDNPYIINNAAELGAIYHYDKSACYRLGSDIHLAGIKWSNAIIPFFKGYFNGNDHVISNMNIEGSNYLGLFGKITGSSAKIVNLGIENVDITGDDYLGGLCGWNEEGTITNCYATGAVTGGYYVGGLCGFNSEGTLINCYAAGAVTCTYGYVGGLCGRNSEGAITNCYAAATVTGVDYLGGLCGSNYKGVITNCYATGTVIGDDYVGGLCGHNRGPITNCFWDVESSGIPYSSGGIGKTTAEMQTMSTFVDAGWDFEEAWWINDGRDYPRLWWQPFGDVNNDCRVDVEDLGIMGANWGMEINGEGIDRRCELSGDEVIGMGDLMEMVDMWLEGPQFQE